MSWRLHTHLGVFLPLDQDFVVIFSWLRFLIFFLRVSCWHYMLMVLIREIVWCIINCFQIIKCSLVNLSWKHFLIFYSESWPLAVGSIHMWFLHPENATPHLGIKYFAHWYIMFLEIWKRISKSRNCSPGYMAYLLPNSSRLHQQ